MSDIKANRIISDVVDTNTVETGEIKTTSIKHPEAVDANITFNQDGKVNISDVNIDTNSSITYDNTNSTVSANNVKEAIDELDSKKAPLDGASFSGPVDVATNNTEAFKVSDGQTPTISVNTTDNRVGVGTDDPQASLHVDGEVRVGDNIRYEQFSNYKALGAYYRLDKSSPLASSSIFTQNPLSTSPQLIDMSQHLPQGVIGRIGAVKLYIVTRRLGASGMLWMTKPFGDPTTGNAWTSHAPAIQGVGVDRWGIEYDVETDSEGRFYIWAYSGGWQPWVENIYTRGFWLEG